MTRAAGDPHSRQGRATRIRDLLRSQILADGVPLVLPTEEVLARDYGVSRNTMREALGMLVDEGLLRRRKGVGTQLIVQRQSRVYGSSRGMAGALPEIASSLDYFDHALEIVVPSPYLTARFGCEERKFVYWERATLLDGAPFSIWRSHLPASIFGRLVYDPPHHSATVYDVIAQVSGTEPDRTRRTVEARPADVNTACRLRVPVGFAMFHIERSIFDPDGTLLELGYGWSRGDNYAVTYDTALDHPAHLT